ncbi:MAG: hypothetical protein RLZZ200_1161 [Pseudomonadota bacterium]
MKSPELAQLVAGLRAGGPDLSASPPVAREGFSAMVAAAPVADDVRFRSLQLAGLPVLESLTPDASADRVLLYFHGGAFVIGSAQDYRSLSANLGRAAGARSLSVDYRLAPEHPFPAAIDDAVAAYRALLGQGIRPGQIVVAGDSAGGGIVLAMLVAARDAGLPLPAAGLLLSPWLDLACTGESMTSRRHEDPSLRRGGLLSMASLYLAGRTPLQPLASPLLADLRDLPPFLVQVGTAEILYSDSVRLAARAADEGVRLTLSVWPDMVHVWHFFSFLLREGREAIDEAGAFLRGQFR